MVSDCASADMRCHVLATAPAIIAFAIYIGVLCTLPMMSGRTMCCEISSIAAAVSKIVYSAPFGAMYQELFEHFVANPATPLQDKLDTATGFVPKSLQPTTRDGNGIGYVLFATATLGVFGLHVWALPLGMVALMGASACAFMQQFPKLAIVPLLYFTVLTVMLFSELTWLPQNFNAAGPGSIRTFSLVGILPAMHLAIGLREGLIRWPLLVLQTAILSFVVLVRGNAVMLAVAIVLFRLPCWRQMRRLAIVPLVLGVIIITSAPAYLWNGRLHDVIWHRVFMSLTLHPQYPFAGLDDMFDCQPYIPTRMHSPDDQNGHCVWWDYAKRNNLSVETVTSGTYSSEYETAVRNALFRIAWNYPRQMVELFFYYKPLMIAEAMRESLQTNWSSYSALSIGLLLVGLANAIIALLQVRVSVSRVLRFSLFAGLLACVPLIAVWGIVATAAAVFFFCLFSLGLAFAAMITAIREIEWLKPLSSPTTPQ